MPPEPGQPTHAAPLKFSRRGRPAATAVIGGIPKEVSCPGALWPAHTFAVFVVVSAGASGVRDSARRVRTLAAEPSAKVRTGRLAGVEVCCLCFQRPRRTTGRASRVPPSSAGAFPSHGGRRVFTCVLGKYLRFPGGILTCAFHANLVRPIAVYGGPRKNGEQRRGQSGLGRRAFRPRVPINGASPGTNQRAASGRGGALTVMPSLAVKGRAAEHGSRLGARRLRG
ncbi:hypothetical protein HPB47_021365 [Ixodes persulcatus]|uniref:Uncharacterized protein n=1 Tax=Ixodes persulcatus TaxID=34615 RepID=A0AC60QCQ5_IXOPE|nr:hypothetical protein HPB47_021365 [Ixodes persulcatus]